MFLGVYSVYIDHCCGRELVIKNKNCWMQWNVNKGVEVQECINFSKEIGGGGTALWNFLGLMLALAVYISNICCQTFRNL